MKTFFLMGYNRIRATPRGVRVGINSGELAGRLRNICFDKAKWKPFDDRRMFLPEKQDELRPKKGIGGSKQGFLIDLQLNFGIIVIANAREL